MRCDYCKYKYYPNYEENDFECQIFDDVEEIMTSNQEQIGCKYNQKTLDKMMREKERKE